jgi:ribosomal protein S18 acetylase RimI-like enzyme
MIRAYKKTDKEKLLEVFKLNAPQYFDPKEVQDFDDYLENYPETYFTIEHNGEVVGGTGYYFKEEDNSGRITWIFFHPESAGMGFGRQSVEYCLNIFKQDKRIKKSVVTTSQLAFHFFEKFGYQLIYTEKDHWGEGLDLYLMEKIL